MNKPPVNTNVKDTKIFSEYFINNNNGIPFDYSYYPIQFKNDTVNVLNDKNKIVNIPLQQLDDTKESIRSQEFFVNKYNCVNY